MNNPYSTIEDLPDFDIEFPDDFVDGLTPTEEDMARADRILGTTTLIINDCDCFYCSDTENESIDEYQEDWAV